MTQFTCEGVKQINNRISLNRISLRFSSAQEFQMGEFPEILITKSRSRFYCTWFFSRAENFCWEEIVRENNVSSAGDPVHAGDKTLTRETPAQRGGLTGMTLSHVWYSGLSNHLIWKWQLPGILKAKSTFSNIWFPTATLFNAGNCSTLGNQSIHPLAYFYK
jgi:hypothetical protein